LLRDEVIGFQGYANVDEAYRAIQDLQESDFLKQEISADWFTCAVVDEFGCLLGKPASEGARQEH
jgi:hypothetical protein